ncbi:hypothetical protein PMI06_009667 [Burkholderia sp. BT03]|jgi:hypothetical protein|nr:hypothetical protein PMI06_009667 [Burkholderia sp. BT03]SKC57691.1 hypothetical protein SAMN06266956_0924 [Paraburkholderia hospita]
MFTDRYALRKISRAKGARPLCNPDAGHCTASIAPTSLSDTLSTAWYAIRIGGAFL